MKVALVHDWLRTIGGGERVVKNFSEVYSESPIYTSIYNSKELGNMFEGKDIRTSFLQNNKKAVKKHQRYLPFMPMAFESFDLNEFEVVLSSSASCSKGIITNSDSVHICYCHSPMRYAWEFYYEYAKREKMNGLKQKFLKYFMNYMRMWDKLSADRVDYYIANSENVAKRIWKHYRRESVVIHPPVRTSLFEISDTDEDYFMVLSRLVPYKRIDLAVEAFNELGLPLVIIGDGADADKLKAIANSNIKFLGRQPDEVIKKYYSKCRAFIFPGEEDFGITPLEAQASGRPVIAYGKGGALETVIDEKTGIFFEEQTVDSLVGAIKKFENYDFDKSKIRDHAMTFDEEIFKKKIEEFVLEKYEEHINTKHWEVK